MRIKWVSFLFKHVKPTKNIPMKMAQLQKKKKNFNASLGNTPCDT